MTSITMSKRTDRRHERAQADEPHLSMRIDQLIKQIDDVLEGDEHGHLLAPVAVDGNRSA